MLRNGENDVKKGSSVARWLWRHNDKTVSGRAKALKRAGRAASWASWRCSRLKR